MTPSVIAIVIGAIVLYGLVSTLIFAIRHGQLKDIEPNKFAFEQYRKSVLLSETLWGLGFLVTVTFVTVLALNITPGNTQMESNTFCAMLVMSGYLVTRIVRAYWIAFNGVTPLMERFGIKGRSNDRTVFVSAHAAPLQKLLVAPEHLDTDQHD